MTKKIVGWTIWDFADGGRVTGWYGSQELAEARLRSRYAEGTNRYGVKPVFVEVDENV